MATLKLADAHHNPTSRMKTPTLDDLRRYAVARTLFAPTTLGTAINRLGFVQADPIRAPARAQDLTLRHRVRDYRAGELERRYEKLAIEEDCLVNYGFLPRAHVALMHPRVAKRAWDAVTRRRAADVLAFVRERGPTHPREVLAAFAHHGRVTGYWGGTLNASTQLLDGLHYRGLLRVVRREAGTRVYEAVHREPADDSAAGRRSRAGGGDRAESGIIRGHRRAAGQQCVCEQAALLTQLSRDLPERLGPHAISANAAVAASRVRSTCSAVCASDGNQVSNCDAGGYTPRASSAHAMRAFLAAMATTAFQ